MRKTFVPAVAAAGLAAVLIQSLPNPKLHAQQAAGAPILRPCGEINAAITRMKEGLPRQQDWIRRAEQQLRDAQQGVMASEEARRALFVNALQDYLTRQIDRMNTLRARVEALQSVGFSRRARREILDFAGKAEAAIEDSNEMQEQLGKLAKAGRSGFDFGQALRENKATLEDLLKFVNDSGISEEALEALKPLAPVTGEYIVEGGKLLIEWGATLWEGRISDREHQRAQDDLHRLRVAYERNRTIIVELEQDLARSIAEGQCPELAAQRSQNPSSLTPPLPEPTAPAPPPPAAAPEKKGGGAGGAITAGLLGAAGVAGYLAYEEYKAGQELVDDGGGNNNGNGNTFSMTYVSSSSGGFTCTFNSGGIINNCTATITVNVQGNLNVGTAVRLQPQGMSVGGNQTTTRNPPGSMTFSLSGGTGSSTCPGTITRLNLIIVSTQVIAASASNLSIPVTCR